MCKHGTTITKILPDFIQLEVQRINTSVDIDACLSDVVDALWAAGVVTRSVCCGHGTSRADILVLERDASKAHVICAGRASVSYWRDGVLCEHVPEEGNVVQLRNREARKLVSNDMKPVPTSEAPTVMLLRAQVETLRAALAQLTLEVEQVCEVLEVLAEND